MATPPDGENEPITAINEEGAQTGVIGGSWGLSALDRYRSRGRGRRLVYAFKAFAPKEDAIGMHPVIPAGAVSIPVLGTIGAVSAIETSALASIKHHSKPIAIPAVNEKSKIDNEPRAATVPGTYQTSQWSANDGRGVHSIFALPMICRFLMLLLGSNAVVVASPELVAARPFADHMVLPMERPLTIWGKAKPGKEVEIRFVGHVGRDRVDGEGNWRIPLPPLRASADGHDFHILSGGESIILRDVLVGQVWLCSGQSNMDFPLARATCGKVEVVQAGAFPSIRLFNLTGLHTSARAYSSVERGRLTPEKFFVGTWQVASPQAVADFSAVGWWTGKFLHQAKGVPIGLIDNSVGGSGAESWLPSECLGARKEYKILLENGWLDSSRVSSWARGRAKLNLGVDFCDHPFRPGFLFDSGVRWWCDFPLTGVLWYQGETNAEIIDDAWNELLLTDLIRGWRQQLGQPQLPFFMVQLPRIGGDDPLRRGWPQFRAVQATVASKLPHVTLVSTVDLGWDSPDVHPPDKRPVGERLGQAAAK